MLQSPYSTRFSRTPGWSSTVGHQKINGGEEFHQTYTYTTAPGRDVVSIGCYHFRARPYMIMTTMAGARQLLTTVQFFSKPYSLLLGHTCSQTSSFVDRISLFLVLSFCPTTSRLPSVSSVTFWGACMVLLKQGSV